MMVIERVSPATMEENAKAEGIELPIEQTGVWADFQSGIPGRKPWGMLLVRDHDNVVAVMSLIDMETHGYHYLRSVHGPVWKEQPTDEQEQEMLTALINFVHSHDKHVAFLRIDVWYHDHADQYRVLSTVPYNETVVLDLTGSDEDILSRMKSRGRRDVRKSLRESPAEIADETEQASKDFSEYYAVMVETAQRDGFNPAPMSDYSDMIHALGPDHCRVFAARVDGKVVSWAMFTRNGNTAVYYYASMLSEVRRMMVPDKLLYTAACALAHDGCTKLDLMGIGNDFAPSLKSLNGFKTKFAKDTKVIAAAYDFPIKKVLYKTLVLMKDVRGKLHKKQAVKQDEHDGHTNKNWGSAVSEKEKKQQNTAE
ncbi:lipid II:glycine glycyltransferase FemX [Bifidobacterium magnum]|uniref:Cell wall biosynthesis-associated protein n=1 Tax=Bifidobacterium magnum TaxID=1692 RepID=A0A087BC26_9BIFI|nr:GNAT family N-acetyltransferase [Bifidobacterium magnum]KFI68576.1 Cell wall biosynthesis-associated protein [Bifidobacterium magnum]